MCVNRESDENGNQMHTHLFAYCGRKQEEKERKHADNGTGGLARDSSYRFFLSLSVLLFFLLLLLCFFKGFCMCLFFFHLDVYEIEKVVGRHTSPHSACNMRICIMCFSFSIWNGKKQNGGSQSEKEELPFLLLCTNMDIVTVLWLGTLCGRLSARRSVSPESSPEIQKRKSTKIKPKKFFFMVINYHMGKAFLLQTTENVIINTKPDFFFLPLLGNPRGRPVCCDWLMFFLVLFFSQKGKKVEIF